MNDSNRVQLTLGLLTLGLCLIPTAIVCAQASEISGTLHNLSVSGPGPIKSQVETEICRFCHIPHNAEIPSPLWTHKMSEAQYKVPSIRTASGALEQVPQPDGSSRLCLSCHDGTVALGDVTGRRQPIPLSGTNRFTPAHSGYIGTDLTGSHPISFVYPKQSPGPSGNGADMGTRSLGEIKDISAVRLDGEGKMQCTTCHDPHSDQYYKSGLVPHFWVKPTFDGVCLACHYLF